MHPRPSDVEIGRTSRTHCSRAKGWAASGSPLPVPLGAVSRTLEGGSVMPTSAGTLAGRCCVARTVLYNGGSSRCRVRGSGSMPGSPRCQARLVTALEGPVIACTARRPGPLANSGECSDRPLALDVTAPGRRGRPDARRWARLVLVNNGRRYPTANERPRTARTSRAGLPRTNFWGASPRLPGRARLRASRMGTEYRYSSIGDRVADRDRLLPGRIRGGQLQPRSPRRQDALSSAACAMVVQASDFARRNWAGFSMTVAIGRVRRVEIEPAVAAEARTGRLTPASRRDHHADRHAAVTHLRAGRAQRRWLGLLNASSAEATAWEKIRLRSGRHKRACGEAPAGVRRCCCRRIARAREDVKSASVVPR